MPALTPHALRQKALREARQAAALRSNLARRKGQRRLQSTDEPAKAGPAASEPACQVHDLEADLAPKGSHR